MNLNDDKITESQKPIDPWPKSYISKLQKSIIFATYFSDFQESYAISMGEFYNR